MKEKVYVDRLFAGYDDTPEIKDFKEEVVSNLTERINNLMAKGLSEENAFEKAASELGDITAIADEVGRRKRTEAIGQLYIGSMVPLTKKTAAGLTVASGLLLSAVGVTLTMFLGGSRSVVIFCLSAILLSAACGLYTYFGLTQETAGHYAMKSRRASAYGAVCFAGVLGASLAAVSFFIAQAPLSFAVGIKSVFVLPAVCGLIFLLASQPKRQKAWLRKMVEMEIENSMAFHRDMVDPVRAARFGVMSAGLWILTFSLFMTFYLTTGWRHPWLVFPFALAIQMFMTAMIFGKKR